MKKRKVVFIAHQDQENLGVGYLSSVLLSKGFDVEIINFVLSENEIFNLVKRADAILVGFSLIFQYHAFQLRDLARHLRKNGIDCHFTVGGHYPSLRFEEILNLVPELDSVVRFEGELTICELAESLSNNKNWRRVTGIAFRRDGKPISNELRPLITNLDLLPFPIRTGERKFQCMMKNCVFIITSRGCVRNCSFCSVRKFYQTPPGNLRRSRSPENVVDEMKELFVRENACIFLFQDDDFFLPGKTGKQWVLDFIHQIELEELNNKIILKINCRPDEVDFNIFRKMMHVGLRLVYLGIESGNEKGLEILNKEITVEESLQAVEILKKLNILFEFGFMLFDPSSTFESVRANIRFLRKICGDGSSPVTFCKMLPYAETDIEKNLISDGRLKGPITSPDYDFLDFRLNRFYDFLNPSFWEWMSAPQGILAKLRWHRFEIEVMKKYYPYTKGIPEYEDFLKSIIATSNTLFFDIVEKAIPIFENWNSLSNRQLIMLSAYQNVELQNIISQFHEGMIGFYKKQQVTSG